ncbi:MAG: CBS domain-containing protein, partial [Planctomycetota bacterium JB042]
VVILCDTGRSYLSKCFNDAWMEENQFLEETIHQTAFEILMAKQESAEGFITVSPDATAHEALTLMRQHEISQIPVLEDRRSVGLVEENMAIDLLIQKADLEKTPVRNVMGPPLPEVDLYADLEQISAALTQGAPAVLVRMGEWSYAIITKFDLLHARR